ncbi:MAG: hypothetical protein GX989_04210 [Firmicutes bacterium]|nr:hypothetical protein [Bacillota bacterium]
MALAVRFRLLQMRSKLTGRPGGCSFGADISPVFESFPPMIAAIMAAIVYYIYPQNMGSS